MGAQRNCADSLNQGQKPPASFLSVVRRCLDTFAWGPCEACPCRELANSQRLLMRSLGIWLKKPSSSHWKETQSALGFRLFAAIIEIAIGTGLFGNEGPASLLPLQCSIGSEASGSIGHSTHRILS